MKQLTVRLDEVAAQKLQKEADKRGVSSAQIIRELIYKIK